jgi:hypothetical protein
VPEKTDDPAPLLPPAAEKVLTGEGDGEAVEAVKLKRELADERSGRKKDQTRLAELEDENRQLKKPPAPPPPPPVKEKKGWMDGATFFNEDD